MQQGISTWRAFVAGIVVAGAVFFSAGIASAHIVANASWYWSGTDAGGTIWCAYQRAEIQESSGTTYQATLGGMTEGHMYVFCTGAAGAPQGYYASSTRMLHSGGSICHDFDPNVIT